MGVKAGVIIHVTKESSPVRVIGEGFDITLPNDKGETSVHLETDDEITIRPLGARTLTDEQVGEELTRSAGSWITRAVRNRMLRAK